MHAIEKKSPLSDNTVDHIFPYTYRSIPANKIIADPSYNRTIKTPWVERIIKNFNGNVVNPCKVSYRDGKYFIFDGNHTLNALVERAGGDDSILIDCKVYQGMTREDEAELFALQFGDSHNVASSQKIRALSVAKNSEVERFKEITERAGARCTFTTSSTAYNIKCYDTAFKIFQKRGDAHYFDVISTIVKAWNGHPQSLCKEIIGGVDIILALFPDIDKSRLVTVLSREAPVEIISRGKSNISTTRNRRFALEIGKAYNSRLSESKKINLIEIEARKV